MQIDLKLDPKALQERFDLTQKNLGFAAVNAINEVAKKIQAAEQQQLQKNFHVRLSTFMLRQAAVIKPFASYRKGVISAEIAVGQKGQAGKPGQLLLSMFEQGGDRVPFVGHNVAVPVTGGAARPSADAKIARKYQFEQMGLHKITRGEQGLIAWDNRTVGRKRRLARGTFLGHGAKSGETILVGNNRTFWIKTARHPAGVIFARKGPDKDDIRTVYAMEAKTRLKPKLGFIPTAKLVADRDLRDAIDDAITKEITRAKR